MSFHGSAAETRPAHRVQPGRLRRAIRRGEASVPSIPGSTSCP